LVYWRGSFYPPTTVPVAGYLCLLAFVRVRRSFLALIIPQFVRSVDLVVALRVTRLRSSCYVTRRSFGLLRLVGSVCLFLVGYAFVWVLGSLVRLVPLRFGWQKFITALLRFRFGSAITFTVTLLLFVVVVVTLFSSVYGWLVG
jgi:hypothetical protein